VISHTETRSVPYPAELMYAVVSDVERYPEFLPWVVARKPDGMSAEMAVGYGGLRERYTSDIKLTPAIHRIDVTQTSGPFKVLENHWQFTPNGEGCDVTFSILFEFKSRLLHSVAGAKFEKVMLKMADAFEARAKQIREGNA
jgi:coenzyme Q-binding protein COQ10